MAASAEGSEVPALTEASSRTAARTLVDAARLGAAVFERPDLAELLAAALDRIDRATTVVAVIGDYKQGKSSLVNALLGVNVAIVDDDIATAIPTVFRNGSEWSATATSRDSERAAEPDAASRRLTAEEYRALVTTGGAGHSAQGGGTAVEVTLPSDLLATGLALLDAPAAGGLSTAAGGLLSGLLRSMDGALYVADLSAPLDQSRLELLRRVAAACPAVLVVRTKTDLYAESRRIMDIDRATLAGAGIDVPMVAVSSVLMEKSAILEDSALAQASGIPALRELLESIVMDDARADAVDRAVGESVFVLDQLLSSAREELAVLESPGLADERRAQLDKTRERLAHLRGPGARWSQALSDRFGDAVGDADHAFKSSMREIARELDERLEQIDPGREWPAFAEWLQGRTGDAGDRLIQTIGQAAIDAEQVARDVLREEAAAAPDVMAALPTLAFDLERLATAKGVEAAGFRAGPGLVFSALRGGQSGFFSMSFLAGIAGITLTGVAAAGIGIVFAGRQIFDERRRQQQARRQAARTAARRFLEDVEFVTSKQSRDAARDLLRSLREHFLDQFTRLQQTCTESAATIEAAVNRDEGERARRAATLRDRIAQLEQLRAATAAAAAAAEGEAE